MSAITHSTAENCSNTTPVSHVPLKEQEYQIESVIEEDEMPVSDISPLKAYSYTSNADFLVCVFVFFHFAC